MFNRSSKSINRFLGTDASGAGQLISRGGFRLLGAITMAVLLSLNETWPIDWLKFLGILLISLVAGLMLRAHLQVHFTPHERRKDERLIWITSLLAVAGVQAALLSLDASSIDRLGYLLIAPIVAQAMLVAALLTPGIGMVAMTMSVLLLGIPSVMPFEFLIAGWLSGSVGSHIVNPMKKRSDLLRALTLLTITQVIIAGSLCVINSYSTIQSIEIIIWSSVSAIIAISVFWLGVVVLERLFHITSDWSLLELCGPDQPLLRELNLRAPGTYAHSVRVGNLAEEAARAVGANPLVCRTLALYHDIGKTTRPNYFIENQIGENVHDELSPNLSAQIIAKHVSDGVELAKENKLPEIIIDGIEQHHGTTLISYFYNRALEQKGEASESVFRYPGPKPKTKEIAILHLADIVEAASRTFKKSDNVSLLIAKLIEKSRADGQLDECELTFKDLGVIQEAFVRNLNAMSHERVLYPGQEEENNQIGKKAQLQSISGQSSQDDHQESTAP